MTLLVSHPRADISIACQKLLKSGFRDQAPEEIYSKWAATYNADSFDVLGFTSPSICAKVAVKFLAEDKEKNDDVSKEKKQLLDMGCGTGALSSLLRETHGLSKHIVLDGSDLTQAMLDEASKHPGLYRTLKRTDISETPWPFASNLYDMVLCNGVLIYVQTNLHSVLREFCRVLKIGGKAVLMVREDDAEKWNPAVSSLEEEAIWELTYQSDKYDNFLNAKGINEGSAEGKVWYNIKVYTKLKDLA